MHYHLHHAAYSFRRALQGASELVCASALVAMTLLATPDKSLCQSINAGSGNVARPDATALQTAFRTGFAIVLDSTFLAQKQFEHIVPKMGIFEDTTRQMTLGEVRSAFAQNAFTLWDTTKPPLHPRSAYWLCVEVENRLLTNPQWMVLLGGNDIRASGRNSYVDVLVVRGDSVLAQKYTGYHRPVQERDIPNIHSAVVVDFPPFQRVLLLVRIVRIYGFPANPALRLVPPLELERTNNRVSPFRIGFAFFMLGALLVMGLFYSIYAVIVRDTTYIFFVSYIFGTWLFFANTFGVWHNFIFPNLPRAEDYLLFLGLILAGFESLFVRSFLRIEPLAARWSKALMLTAILGVGGMIICAVLWAIFQEFPFVNSIQILVLLAITIIQLLLSVSFVRSGRTLLRYVAAANFMLYGTFATFVFALFLPQFLGLASPIAFADSLYVASFGAVGRVILFALGFGYRSKLLEQERLQAQAGLIEQLQKNDQLQRDANAKLEHKVRERTAELETTNEQVSEANIEIERQITILEEQSREIEIRNSELQEVNQELAVANEFKLKMLGIAAHDLKNPISNILLSAQFIHRKAESKKILQYTESITESGEQMLSIIDNLLESAALGLGKVELELRSFDIVLTLQAICSQFAYVFEAKKQHFYVTCPERCYIQGDEVRIRQVIDNLLSNASKYSPLHGKIELNLERMGEIIHLSVRDSGPGLTEEDKTKLFGMFQRLSAQPTGGESSSGVGLASVKNIVELHGGTIEVRSEGGKGSTFILTLPIIAG
jgi:two-component system, sensor histidine kinase LadS